MLALPRSICIALFAASLAAAFALPPGSAAAHSEQTPDDVTFGGTLSGGGTMLLTVTADRAGVTRVELDEAVFFWKISRVLYFDPPRPIVDGQFELSVPDNLFGQVRGFVEVRGGFESDTELAGTATFVVCSPGCDDWRTVDWNLAGPLDTPPGPDDTIHVASIEGDTGTLALTTDAAGNLTSFALKRVTFPPCLERAVSLRAFFDPPGPLDERAGILVAFQEGLFPVALLDVERTADKLSGSLALSAGFYKGDCQAILRWNISGFFPAPTVQSTPTASVVPAAAAPSPTTTPQVATSEPNPTPQVAALPSAGGGGGRGGVPGVALLALGFGVLSAALGMALRARGVAR